MQLSSNHGINHRIFTDQEEAAIKDFFLTFYLKADFLMTKTLLKFHTMLILKNIKMRKKTKKIF